MTVDLYSTGTTPVAVATTEVLDTLTDPGVYVVYLNLTGMIATDLVHVFISRDDSTGGAVLVLQDVQDFADASLVVSVPTGVTATVEVEFVSGASATLSPIWSVDRIH